VLQPILIAIQQPPQPQPQSPVAAECSAAVLADELMLQPLHPFITTSVDLP
jgi:hypothetical protein